VGRALMVPSVKISYTEYRLWLNYSVIFAKFIEKTVEKIYNKKQT